MDDDTTVADMKYVRAEIGFVFQLFNLFPHLTIMENITLAPMKVKGIPKREAEDQAMVLLERVGIPEQAYKYPSATLRRTAAESGDRPRIWRWTRRSCCSTSRHRPSTRR